ncbi:hypothetical protein HK097_009048 [Rhizophlyctis rosea]|uniref:Uncharacterized protein n=1 Tax=Rhizophlyctis rosea TaxID=64517 RepID=A0AAD5X956_9FUNG|nr:hypothetical protein HK097_009048 [Rhizophlyctis rosea]
MLLSTAPLARTYPYDPSIAEPLIASPPLHDLLSTLASLELLLRKQQSLSLLPTTSEREASLHHLQKEISSFLSILTPLFKQISAGRSLAEFVQTTGLNNFYPRCARALNLTVDVSGQKQDYIAWQQSLIPLNKISHCALQIRSDIQSNRLRYLAHQIALLYQCLANSPLQRYQSRIQERFDDLKQTLTVPATASQDEASEPPQANLRDDQKEWLNALTIEIIKETVYASKLVPDAVAAAFAHLKR